VAFSAAFSVPSLGTNVVIAGRDGEAAATALAALRTLGVEAEFILTDVTHHSR
jgi:hypothetical protein